MKTTVVIDKALLEEEIKDTRARRDQANAALTQYNAAAQKAQQEIIGYSYVEQQLFALIAKLEAPDAKPPVPAPKP